jgi:hypothetical protein
MEVSVCTVTAMALPTVVGLRSRLSAAAVKMAWSLGITAE